MMAPEIWGGLEGSIVRVGDTFVDELELTGHLGRIEDLDRVAALGIRTLRYPVLWERVWPLRDREPDWRFSDERLERIALRLVR